MGIKFSAACTLDIREYRHGIPSSMCAADGNWDKKFPCPSTSSISSRVAADGKGIRDISFSLVEGDFQVGAGGNYYSNSLLSLTVYIDLPFDMGWPLPLIVYQLHVLLVSLSSWHLTNTTTALVTAIVLAGVQRHLAYAACTSRSLNNSFEVLLVCKTPSMAASRPDTEQDQFRGGQ